MYPYAYKFKFVYIYIYLMSNDIFYCIIESKSGRISIMIIANVGTM